MWGLAALLLAVFSACRARSGGPAAPPAFDWRFAIGGTLFRDDFTAGLGQWTIEAERPGRIEARNGRLEIDVPAGCTVWFRSKLSGPVMIEYRAAAIGAGGPNDRVSDLNCFWMAADSRAPGDIFARRRSGAFADYDLLTTYYVGLGGNGNTTTRFRRYVGKAGNRPIDPKDDLRGAENLLAANAEQTLRLVACDHLIQFYRDGKRLFETVDPQPYREGWFAFRTTQSHMEIRDFRVYRLVPTL